MDSVDDLLNAFSNIALSTRLPITKEDEKRIADAVKNDIEKGKRMSVSSKAYFHPTDFDVEVWGVVLPETKKDLRRESRMDMMTNTGPPLKCRLAKYPFSKGSVRAAYFGRLWQDGVWKDIVLKQFMIASQRTESEYKNQSENSAVAHFLIGEYCHTHRTRKRIRVLKSRVVKIRQGADTVLYNMEEKLQGDFKKWTNNGGSILEKNEDLISLALWSHSYSSGYLLVTDIQGVETSDEIILTDPAVLCTDLRRFGPTNFASAQMQICLEALQHGMRRDSTMPRITDTLQPDLWSALDEKIIEALRCDEDSELATAERVMAIDKKLKIAHKFFALMTSGEPVVLDTYEDLINVFKRLTD